MAPSSQTPASAPGEDRKEKDSGPLWVVTGAAGFLGNNLVRALLAQDQHVRAAIVEESTPRSLLGLDVEVVRMDVRDRLSVAAAFEPVAGRQTWVIHCAGIVSISDTESPLVRHVNVDGVVNVLDACSATGVARLVYVSSIHSLPVSQGIGREKDNPEDYDPALVSGAYSKTKAEATRLVLEDNGLWRVVVLPTGMIGPRDYADTNMTRMVRDAASGALPISVSGGYDFVDVRDVADGIILAARKGIDGHTYILSGAYVSTERMVGAVASAKKRPRPFALPRGFIRLFTPLARWVAKLRGTEPIVTASSLGVLGEPGQFTSQRAYDELGYRTRPFQETLRDTLEWIETYKAE